MMHAKVLDCTLRDGAYLIDKNFGELNIKGIISGLVEANMDFIEIGFLQNEGFGEGKTVFLNSQEAKKYIPKDKKNSQFAVLADYSRYSIENLDVNQGDSFDAVRECFFKKERKDALEVCKVIKKKGYKVFVQPVDILGYTDAEILELIDKVNEVEPYCLSIVDTFGSMYTEDLRRIFSLIHHNLVPSCKIGFHSHNNMQLSNALSQEFLQLSLEIRNVVVDTTLCGMGRGAGNTPTELVVQYMISHMGYPYNIDAILDTIDNYINNIRTRCEWGYTIPFFIAGAHTSHVNNITYLLKKNGIRSKDIQYILNSIEGTERKRYDYQLLEEKYFSYMTSDIDDSDNLSKLADVLKGRNVLILAPGKSVTELRRNVKNYIKKKQPIVITVNYVDEEIESDYVFMSNVKRHDFWKNDTRYNNAKKIYTSNITGESKNDIVCSYIKLLKAGWNNLDNAVILLLRLLDKFEIAEIGIAGFDGYYMNEKSNFVNEYLNSLYVKENPLEINNETTEMCADYTMTREKTTKIILVTPSRFKNALKGELYVEN